MFFDGIIVADTFLAGAADRDRRYMMKTLFGTHARLALALGLMLALAPVAARAGNAPEPDKAAWQDVINVQITAFRHQDAAEALAQAGAVLRRIHTNPSTYLRSVRRSGYETIVQSWAHGFGAFKLRGRMVEQIVILHMPDQKLFEARFTLAQESGAWKVQRVALKRQRGISI